MERELSSGDRDELMSKLKVRFEKNMKRHEGLDWTKIEERLLGNPKKLWSLGEMEATEGEPDVIGVDDETKQYVFVDCSPESPKGRRSLCYDRKALDGRKENKPLDSAMDMAVDMGVDLLTEDQYKSLQQLGKFDTKTSSWVLTPDDIRKLGGAVFCDRRYDQVFLYHNGADSYYAARGFRGMLKV